MRLCLYRIFSCTLEKRIDRFKIFNYAHAYKLIFEYIEIFYNTVRIHSHCGRRKTSRTHRT